MSDEDDSSRTMSDESDAGSNQGDVDSIYDESNVDPGPMTAGERERLLVMALSALMSGSQNRLDYDLLAMQFPGRTSTYIQGEMDRLFREHSHLSLGMIEEQGSMARFLALVRMRFEIEYELQQWLEEILQEILEESFDEMLNVSAGTTRNDLPSSANAALTHSQQLGGGYQVNFDDDQNDSGYEGSTAGNGQVNSDDEQNDSGYEDFTADDEDDDSGQWKP